ncbi:MAG: hypothetical protein [Inoviridae sp.]|nr:MAG: hypothetical protein [Inoviridae sp.]
MSYQCKTLVTPQNSELPVCTEWQESTLLPDLTTADRDILLSWAIGIFALVFIVRKIMRLF